MDDPLCSGARLYARIAARERLVALCGTLKYTIDARISLIRRCAGSVGRTCLGYRPPARTTADGFVTDA